MISAFIFKTKKTLISFFNPGANEALMNLAKSKEISVIAMDMVPRISRAQKMDALSSMANIAGYRAVIESGKPYLFLKLFDYFFFKLFDKLFLELFDYLFLELFDNLFLELFDNLFLKLFDDLFLEIFDNLF